MEFIEDIVREKAIAEGEKTEKGLSTDKIAVKPD